MNKLDKEIDETKLAIMQVKKRISDGADGASFLDLSGDKFITDNDKVLNYFESYLTLLLLKQQQLHVLELVRANAICSRECIVRDCKGDISQIRDNEESIMKIFDALKTMWKISDEDYNNHIDPNNDIKRMGD